MAAIPGNGLCESCSSQFDVCTGSVRALHMFPHLKVAL